MKNKGINFLLLILILGTSAQVFSEPSFGLECKIKGTGINYQYAKKLNYLGMKVDKESARYIDYCSNENAGSTIFTLYNIFGNKIGNVYSNGDKKTIHIDSENEYSKYFFIFYPFILLLIIFYLIYISYIKYGTYKKKKS